ncbi:MAG: heme lyase CcmF/NrfE family subunit [Alphaproteobacteria bacterium]|jgi:cytochrome c-type biogenesis protein CcmF|nr:heme lyase CcmF/NrfE family subunit [Alphaproteobacteria bacterium]
MIPELGHFALILALLLAVVQAGVPLAGAARGRADWMAVGEPAALGQLAAVLLAFLALTWAYVVSDFTVENVIRNSHSAKPMIYKISGVWGNHEGSMVLWVLILAAFGAMVALFGGSLPATLRARVLAVQGMIGVGFLTFILFTSNPFTRVFPPPLDGNDLNPLLQDPGLAFHPPLLYFGYVGFSMAFSFAVAGLLEGRVDAAWARWVRPWTVAAWAGLTLGIALGSWWAYYELGWGGWWFWDPVENASLMPWLAGTALLHSAIVVEKREALKGWTILLAILTFGLSLLGTFLVRSGVLTSVHAFAVDPARGVYILVLLAIAVGGALVLYALRAPSLSGGGVFAPVSREGALVLNNLFLSTATVTVFLGTLYPLFLEAAGGGRVSVGPPFFEATFVPLMLPMLVLMAIGPMMAWKRSDLAGALGRLKVAAGLTALVILGTLAWRLGGPVMALVGLALAAWVFFGALAEFADRIRLFRLPLADSWRRAKGLPRSAWGMTLAHAGLGIAIAGMTASSAFLSERIARLEPGGTIEIAGYDLRFEGVELVAGPNYQAQRATITVTAPGRRFELTPENRWYPVAQQATTEAAIRTTWLADLYVVLGDRGEAGGWTIRAFHHPLVPWIWLGTGLMAVGGLVSLGRTRAAAPAGKRAATRSGGGRPAAAPAPAPGHARLGTPEPERPSAG